MASEEKLFENVNGRMHGRTDTLTDGRKVITIAHPEQSSGELIKRNNSKGPGPIALILFSTIQLVILVMCTKVEVCR